MITEDELIKIKQALTSIRTESNNDDVWDSFVIPRFFHESELKSHHSLRIEGSRGSGKTMILKYLSYKSQFSEKRKDIPYDTIKNIGIYWKADPQFLRTLDKRSLDTDQWRLIFDNYTIIKISIEIINSVFAIGDSSCEAFTIEEIKSCTFKGIKDYRFENESIEALHEELKSKLRKTEMAIMNIRAIDNLDLLPSTFLTFLVQGIKEVNSDLKFYVYVDEYENLLSYQQIVINTKIKTSDSNVNFNIAIKKNGMSEYQTLSNEKLENIADYRIVNLDEKIKQHGINDYLAEILIKKLADSSSTIDNYLQFDSSLLNKPEKLEVRESSDYIKKLNKVVTSILPERSSEDLANEIFSHPTFLKILKTDIDKPLKNRKCEFTSEVFIDGEHKKASIVCSSLLYRNSLTPEIISTEFTKLKAGIDNNFTGRTEWVHNNFIGTYLRIISSYSQNSTFYSGFDVFCQLSSGNVRHFLELCRTSFGFIDVSNSTESFTIDNKGQDIAARQTSETLVREVKQFTPHGARLYKLVEGLGTLFNFYQKSLTQSESEITQFGFSNSEVLEPEDNVIIRESEKWGILIIKDSTKEKSTFETGLSEYILNPIYSPKFSISYRKGRKKILNINEFRLLYNEGKTGAEKVVNNESKNKDVNFLQGSLEW